MKFESQGRVLVGTFLLQEIFYLSDQKIYSNLDCHHTKYPFCLMFIFVFFCSFIIFQNKKFLHLERNVQKSCEFASRDVSFSSFAVF